MLRGFALFELYKCASKRISQLNLESDWNSANRALRELKTYVKNRALKSWQF